jgi:hypothetical protein
MTVKRRDVDVTSRVQWVVIAVGDSRLCVTKSVEIAISTAHLFCLLAVKPPAFFQIFPGFVGTSISITVVHSAVIIHHKDKTLAGGGLLLRTRCNYSIRWQPQFRAHIALRYTDRDGSSGNIIEFRINTRSSERYVRRLCDPSTTGDGRQFNDLRLRPILRGESENGMGLLLQLTGFIADPNLDDGFGLGAERHSEGGKCSRLVASLKLNGHYDDSCLSEIGIASIYANFGLGWHLSRRGEVGEVRARIFAAPFCCNAPARQIESATGLLVALILLREYPAAALICIVKDFKSPHPHPKRSQPFLPKTLHRTTPTTLRCSLDMLWRR